MRAVIIHRIDSGSSMTGAYWSHGGIVLLGSFSNLFCGLISVMVVGAVIGISISDTCNCTIDTIVQILYLSVNPLYIRYRWLMFLV